MLDSMSSEFSNKVVGYNFAYQVWDKLQVYFASRVQAKISQLKAQLKLVRKDGSVSNYLLKKIVDFLTAVCAPVTTKELIIAILDGLNKEYSAFVTSIVSRSNPYVVKEVEAQLMAQEERIERFQRMELDSVQAYSAQTTVNDPRFASRGNGGGRRGRGCGRGGRSIWINGSRPTCQLYGRVGHIVWQYFHYFDHNFQGQNRGLQHQPPPPSFSFHNPQGVQAYLATPVSPSFHDAHRPQAFLATPATLSMHHGTQTQVRLII